MNVKIGTKEYDYYDKLITQIHEWDIISDDLTRFDVQDCADYDEFFVFEDTLDEIMLAFSRDPQISSLCTLNVNSMKLKANHQIVNNQTTTTIHYIPPSCIIPYHRQSLFAAPVAYQYTNHEELYFLFRSAVYCKYWHKLHIISSKKDTIFIYLSYLNHY